MKINSLYNPTVLKRGVRFGLTGVLMTAFHALLATLCIEIILITPSLANGIAALISTYISYLINTKWSFSRQCEGKILTRFYIVSLFGLLLAMGISHGIDQIGLHYAYGILAVVCIIPPVNFLLHQFWTYR